MNNRLNWNDFVQLEHEIITAFFEQITDSNKKIEEDLLAIGFRVIIDIANVIRINNQESDIEVNNIEINDFFSQFKDQNFCPKVLYENELWKYTPIIVAYKKLKAFIYINRFRIHLILKKPIYVSLENYNHIAMKKMSEYGIIFPYSVSRAILRSRNISGKNEESKKVIKEICTKLVTNINRRIHKAFPTRILNTNGIREILFNHLNEFYCDYESIKKSKLPKKLILGTHNKTFLRLFSRAMQDNNNEVISFAHGHTLQNKDDHKLWMDLILSNYYVEQSKDLAEELISYLRNHPFKELISVHISYTKQNINTDHVLTVKPPLNMENVRNVLVVGNATKLNGLSSVTSFEPIVQVDVELSVMKYFKNLKKDIYYKPHPSGKLKKLVCDFYNTFGYINIENGRFEDIIQNYDLIVFYYTRTTTIREALNSRKPLMVIDLEIEKLCKRSKMLLKDRTIIITYTELLKQLKNK